MCFVCGLIFPSRAAGVQLGHLHRRSRVFLRRLESLRRQRVDIGSGPINFSELSIRRFSSTGGLEYARISQRERWP